MTGLSPLRRGQLLGMPLSGLLMGPLAMLAFERTIGWPLVLGFGLLLSLAMCAVAGWMVLRSDYGARHALAGAALFALLLVPLLGGGSLLAVTMMGAAALGPWAVLVATATVLLPLLVTAWQTLAQLRTQGAQGEWARRHLDASVGVMHREALMRQPGDGGALAPWMIGALSVNLVWLLRSHGGTDAQLLPWAMALLAVGVVWGAVTQVGPALGKGLFMLQLERQTGRRYRHEHWPDIQAVRFSFWLSRLLMPPFEASPTAPESRAGRRRGRP